MECSSSPNDVQNLLSGLKSAGKKIAKAPNIAEAINHGKKTVEKTANRYAPTSIKNPANTKPKDRSLDPLFASSKGEYSIGLINLNFPSC